MDWQQTVADLERRYGGLLDDEMLMALPPDSRKFHGDESWRS